jgi:hypothetical protein
MSSSISNSSGEQPGSTALVVKRLAWFLLPFILFPGTPIVIAILAGELTPLTTVVRRQIHEPLLYGRAYRDDYFAFKLIATEMRRPQTLVLGSSRVMQFRQSFFDPAASFYNAGGAASTMADALEFMRRIEKTARPHVVILGVDQVWLTRFAAFDQEKMNVADSASSADLQRAVRVSHRVVNDLLDRKISLPRLMKRSDPLDHRPALGMGAIMLGNGFRSDGSYQYGPYRIRRPPLEERLQEGFVRIRENVVPMVRASSISSDVLLQLRELLEQAHLNDIRVIGFCPPFAPTTLAAMRQNGGFAYLSEIPATLGRLFGDYGYEFMDWSDPSPLGVGDDDMIDYFHPSEDVVRRIYARLAVSETRPSVSAGGRRANVNPQ